MNLYFYFSWTYLAGVVDRVTDLQTYLHALFFD